MRKALPIDSALAFEPKDSLLERTYRAYKAELCRYIERQFGLGPPDAEEVVHAAFARFAALEKPQEIANARAFLYACSRNVVLDSRRRDRVRDAALHDEIVADPGDEPANLDIERVLLGREQLAIVETVVRAMEAKRRKVFVMHAVHEMRYVEIAREMCISEARVRQLMASALAECQKALDASSLAGSLDR
ncbi:RNA polymerase sigma factor [Sphingomonas sp. MG17]|uniref:RNA polymerase sigma factor n=1 Tax=Sphingomonas tagetis TaxID=2949092 RepID=A0A9X2HMS3_9SPHN|nr:RNA polymerase sigma factor [Sphingomonas tagetis]MCP3730549.1 RNA polymerase sigma factor [Sphingomonas tagetis]